MERYRGTYKMKIDGQEYRGLTLDQVNGKLAWYGEKELKAGYSADIKNRETIIRVRPEWSGCGVRTRTFLDSVEGY